MAATFKAPQVGETRGPWRSSPGNPYPWQAAYYTGAGWVYHFSRTSGHEALRQARQAAAVHMASLPK